MNDSQKQREYVLPPMGNNPSSTHAGTTPGSFALKPSLHPGVEGARTYASPDTPGMPGVSEKTAWDFLPDGWSTELCSSDSKDSLCEYRSGLGQVQFVQSDDSIRSVSLPTDFQPITQLEFARLGVTTPEMVRVSEREGHLTAIQVREEVAAGRLVIPANKMHLGYHLDPMAIGRGTKTKINANMGASPVSSSTDEEVEKLKWAEKWGADTVMDLSTGGDLDACREAIIQNSNVPIGTVPIYSMIIGRKLEDLTPEIILDTLRHQAKQG
ncbi:MAG: phosphomethylpyrimidine synthase ThiC, partial [Rubripirellula sp.]